MIPFPYNLLVYAIALAAIVGGLFAYKHSYDESKRDEGRAEVRAEWAAVNAAQKVRDEAAGVQAFKRQERNDAARDADFKRQLAKRENALLARLSAERISAELTSGLRESVRTANGLSESPAKPEVGERPTAGPTDGRSLDNWFAVVAEKYRRCREHEVAWLKWDDERVTQ